jgi:hypothetical protein
LGGFVPLLEISSSPPRVRHQRILEHLGQTYSLRILLMCDVVRLMLTHSTLSPNTKIAFECDVELTVV